MPPSLPLGVTTSFGHFDCTPSHPICSRAFATPMPHATGRPDSTRSGTSGLMSTERYSPPSGDVHPCDLRPLPDCCTRARRAVPSGSAGAGALHELLICGVDLFEHFNRIKTVVASVSHDQPPAYSSVLFTPQQRLKRAAIRTVVPSRTRPSQAHRHLQWHQSGERSKSQGERPRSNGREPRLAHYPLWENAPSVHSAM